MSKKGGVVNNGIGRAIDGAYTGTGELLGAMVGEFIEETFDVGTNISFTDKDGALDLGLKKSEELGR